MIEIMSYLILSRCILIQDYFWYAWVF